MNCIKTLLLAAAITVLRAGAASAQSQIYDFITIAGRAGTQGTADGTNSAARFNNPSGVALDGAGNVYVADWNNHTIRKITPVGTNWVSSTIAGLAGSPGSAGGTNSQARFNFPIGIAVDSGVNIYVAD